MTFSGRKLDYRCTFLATIGMFLAGCAINERDTEYLNLTNLGLRQPSSVLENIAHSSSIKEYTVSASSLYVSFFKPSSTPLHINRSEDVTFSLADRRYQFSPALAGPAPSFWADKILIYSRENLYRERSVQLPGNMQLSFPLWSPSGELLAFVVRDGTELFVGVYSPSEGELRISRAGNVSFWIAGQTFERALTEGGDTKAPFYWTSDSNHIVYGRRVFAPDKGTDVYSAASVPTVMDTGRMRDLIDIQNSARSSRPIELDPTWRQYLFESQVVQLDVRRLTERVLSSPGHYKEILPLSGKGDWLVSTFPDSEEGRISYIRLGRREERLIEIGSTVAANTRVYPASGNREGVYVWGSSRATTAKSVDCFYYVDMSSSVDRKSHCLNEENTVINLWRRQDLFLLDESSSGTRQIRIIDGVSGTTLGRSSLNEDSRKDIGLECADFVWWPAPTSTAEYTEKKWTSLLISATCGAAFARSLIDVTWLSDIGTGDIITVMPKGETALNANTLRLSESQALVLTEYVDSEPKYCLRYIATTGCEQVGPSSPSLDLDSFSKLGVFADRRDGISLRGTLLLPKTNHRAVNGRFPTVILQYPTRQMSPDSFVPGEYGDKRLFSLSHIGDYVELWLAPALLELGFAVLYFPDWPYFGDYSESTFGPFEEQSVRNAEAYVKALSEIEHVDSERLGITGLSAGGNEALLVAASIPDISFAMAFSPAVNMSINPQGNHFQKRNFWEDNRYYLAMSPALRANEIKQPVLLIHALGDENHLSPAAATRSFYFGHNAVNGTSRIVLLPGGSHVLTNQNLKAHVLFEVERWLNSITAQ